MAIVSDDGIDFSIILDISPDLEVRQNIGIVLHLNPKKNPFNQQLQESSPPMLDNNNSNHNNTRLIPCGDKKQMEEVYVHLAKLILEMNSKYSPRNPIQQEE